MTLLFTDIEGFTSFAESLPPDELAELLGRYFEAMTAAVRPTGGTIDKYIGDALMALWNAPARCRSRARPAARRSPARARRALYASRRVARPAALLTTRFGIHTAEVLVGHFGAPERFSYTALGDGVNLASRLEALGKQYGVTSLVSEAVVARQGASSSFRRIDKVAVKGKSAGVVVYELDRPGGSNGDVDRDLRRLRRGPGRLLRATFRGRRRSPRPSGRDGLSVEVATGTLPPSGRRPSSPGVGRRIYGHLEVTTQR